MNKELTIRAIIVGIPIAVVMTAANVYLGLKAGMTVAASIPAAVVAMGVFRGLMGQKSPHETNIIQTMASAGESLAAGVIFTVPALVLVGAWKGFQFWPTYMIAATGGILGILFMIPLRKALVVEDPELIYPEGVACASVIEAGQEDGDMTGMKTIGKGLLIGGLFKFFASGLKVLTGSVEKAFMLGKSSLFLGADVAPALVGVGYIVNLHIASLVFIGGVMGWVIGIPLLATPAEFADMGALDLAWTLWSTKIRYIGVGAMVVGGVWSIFSVRKGIVSGLKEVQSTYKGGMVLPETETNMSFMSMMVIMTLAFLGTFYLFSTMIDSLGLTFFTTVLMILLSFFLVAVAVYICGLVGSSNSPVSGMTISALLVTAAFFLVLGLKGDSAMFATLGVAAVVCCATCTSGDCAQDLKTGYLLGTSPRNQQWAQIIGVLVPALVLAPVLALLHNAYGIGEGLKAPQATLFASIVEGFFGDGTVPVNFVMMGVVLGIVMVFIDELYFKPRKGFRLYLMPTAIGIYLPITLAVPIFAGGLVRMYVEKKRTRAVDDSKDQGILLSSGYIAGEAIMGVVVALFVYFQIPLALNLFSAHMVEILSVLAFVFICKYLYKVSKAS